MKFFSRAWATGEVGDDESAAVARAYESHLDRVLARLPAIVGTLARGINLHDGLIRCVRFDRRTRALLLALRCGDQQAGYFDLDLSYLAVDWAASRLDDLAAIANSQETEALYDEVDASESEAGLRCVHRILFWPVGEIEVVCENLALILVPRDDRRVDRDVEAHEEDPDTRA